MKARSGLLISGICAALAIAMVAWPLWVIRPFVPEDPRALASALELRRLAPMLTIACFAVAGVVLVASWVRARALTRTALCFAMLLIALAAVASRINIFERMFHPDLHPRFGLASEAKLDPRDMVIAVTLGGQARAYPIRELGYHHVINDTIADQPIAITYCTLCHTGLVWSRVADDHVLTFRLAGINNGNALLGDEQTSSIWQQSTGQAIFGSLKGWGLEQVNATELTFAQWRAENPQGEVLLPDPSVQALYDPADWEAHIARTPVVVDVRRSGIDPHEIMLGARAPGGEKAYPLRVVLSAGLIEDSIVSHPLMIVVGDDGASIRAFDPELKSFVRLEHPAGDAFMTDTATGSLWSFAGCAVAGVEKGHCLIPYEVHKTFWFDWLNHYPKTEVYR